MMANAPLRDVPSSLLDGFKGDNGMQEIDSAFTSLSFSTTMSKGGSQKSDHSPLSPVSSTLDRTFQNAFCPTSPVSPVVRHGNRSQYARHSSFGDDSQGIGARNSIASPIIHSGRAAFSPVIGTPRSVDGRSSQFGSGSNKLDPLSTAFLPPPPNLDGTDLSSGIGRSDNSGLFLSGGGNTLKPSSGSQGLSFNPDQEPRSPFVSTPKKQSHPFSGETVTRDRSFSSPGPGFRQLPYGAKSPAASSSNQTLYEDRPYEDRSSSSWNEGPAFPTPSVYRPEAALSPRGGSDRFASRPPRHGGMKNTSDIHGLNSPTNHGRRNISEGNFNFSMMSNAVEHMSPRVNNNHMRSQSHGGVVGSPSFESGGQYVNRNSIGSGGIDDAYNSEAPFMQHQSQINSYNVNHDDGNYDQMNNHSRSLSLPPPGFIHGSPQDYGQNFVPQDQIHYDNPNPRYYVQKPQVQQLLQRHHSTGSHNILVNERGEIIGHSSPAINQGAFDSHIRVDQGHGNFSQIRQHRSNSYGGHQVSPYNQNLDHSHENYHLGYQPNFPDDPNSRTSPSPGNDGMMHQRNNTEPILPNIYSRKPGNGKVLSSRTVSVSSDDFDHALAGESIEGLDGPNDPRHYVPKFGPSEKEACYASYANTIVVPRSNSTEQVHMKGRGSRYDTSSQPLTAGANLSKSGPKMVYNVKFKRSQRNFVLGQRVTREIKIGCYVKVEADRGEDLGIVLNIVPMEKYLASNRPNSETNLEEDPASGEGAGQTNQIHPVGGGELKRIMRVATHDEISLLEVKREEEEELLKVCRAKIRQRGLNMSVIDAEYQFDRNKLTFFFEAEGRIDFRELVRDLFSMYKTRIWMQQLDKDESPGNRATIEESDRD